MIVAILALPMAAAQEERIEVPLGYSELLKIDGALESVIVGNPEIADTTIISNFGIVLTGREVGSTNLIIADAAGDEIFAAIIKVVPLDRRPEFTVRVMKGGSQEDATLYRCGPQPGCIAVDKADQNEGLTTVVEGAPSTTGGEASPGTEPAVIVP